MYSILSGELISDQQHKYLDSLLMISQVDATLNSFATFLNKIPVDNAANTKAATETAAAAAALTVTAALFHWITQQLSHRTVAKQPHNKAKSDLIGSFQLLSHERRLGIDELSCILHLHQEGLPSCPHTLFHLLLFRGQLTEAHANHLECKKVNRHCIMHHCICLL